MINLYRIEKTQAIPIPLPDMSSLDAITRQLPDGYYSTFRTFGTCTRVLGLKSHLRRLFGPVTAPDVDASELRRQLLLLLEPFRPDEARVRVMMTKAGQVYVAIEPLKALPTGIFESGVRVETIEIQRESPRLKSTAFIGASDLERKHIAQEGIFEALLVKNGRILEGMTSNFFYAKDNILCTAQRAVLLGVTRRTIIYLARGRGVEVNYQPLKKNQLSDVNETFITSSSRGVVPVIQIDKVTIGQGRPGQITRMLMSAYDDHVLQPAEKI